jgi:hypothetical protein
MVSPNIVRALAKRVAKGAMTPEAAGVKLAKLCPCGIFNPVRAAKIIEGM